jgi:putative transcriptional regulator
MQATMARVRIEELLQERGITAYRLAIDTGITHSTIAKLRHGKAREIRLDVIDKLCEVLQCDAGELIEVESVKKRAARKG